MTRPSKDKQSQFPSFDLPSTPRLLHQGFYNFDSKMSIQENYGEEPRRIAYPLKNLNISMWS